MLVINPISEVIDQICKNIRNNRMKKILFATAAVAALSSTPAFAQEAGDFSGVKGTAIAGYDNTDFNLGGVGGADNLDGFLFGASLGWDGQSSNVVYGVEAEITESTGKISGGGVSVSASRDLYAGVRLGFVAGDSALIYAKGGYTNARYKATGVGGGNADGLRVGGGVDFKVSENVFIRGEYRYSNYEAGVDRHQVVGGLGFAF